MPENGKLKEQSKPSKLETKRNICIILENAVCGCRMLTFLIRNAMHRSEIRDAWRQYEAETLPNGRTSPLNSMVCA
jgi:hypothetical protein